MPILRSRGCDLVRWTVSSVTYCVTVWTFLGAKRLECAELAPAFGSPTLNDSASKLDALQTLRVTGMPIFLYVSAFRAVRTKPPPDSSPSQGQFSRSLLSPEAPGAFPEHPKPEQAIGDGVCRHRVAEPVLADHQPLIGQAAYDARDPAVRVHQAKDRRGDHERKRMELPERHCLKVGLYEHPIEEGTVEDLFHGRDNHSHACQMNDHVEPGSGGACPKLLKRRRAGIER